MHYHYIGADLSKDTIDIHHPQHNTHRKIANTPRAIRAFLETMQDDEIIVFEATSGCDNTLLAQIRARNAAFVRVNPMHAWHFARACNLAKTDKVDARMLSAFKDIAAQEKNRLARCADPDMKRDIKAMLAVLERRIVKLEKQIVDHLNASAELRQISRLLQSAPGIGPVSASVLIADMPELGHADRRQIVSLAGLAPRAYESGKYKGRRRLGPGRRHVRKVLYMAALSVVAQGRYFQPFITRMKAEGKASKTIIMAIARKLLTILNTLVNQQVPFDSERLLINTNPQ